MLQNLQWGLAPMQVRTTDADDSDGDSTVFVIPNGGPLLRVPECIRRRHEQDEIINLVSSDEEEEDKPPPKKIRRLLRGKLNVPSPSSEPFPLVHIDKGTRLPNRRDTAGVFDRRDSGKGLTAEKEHNPPQQRLNYTVSKIGESLEKELSTSTNTVECGGRDGSPDHDLDTLDEVAIVPRVPTAGQRNVFEHLPSEILITILSRIECDKTLIDTFSAAPALLHYGITCDWQLWQNRFLTLYDAPVIENKDEWMVAYQLRQFVLRTLSYRFEHEDQEHMNVQLQVVKDMVLEAYNTLQRQNRQPMTGISKNLVLFSSPEGASCMINLLSASYYAGRPTITPPGARRPRRCSPTESPNSKDDTDLDQSVGVNSELFSALQVTLSYLVLSPNLHLTPWIRSDRDRYLLAQVYCWNQPLVTLWRKKKTDHDGDTLMTEPVQDLAREMQTADQTLRPFSRFPNLRRPQPRIEVIEVDRVAYELDMHTLLHIRNFWQRHLISETMRDDDAASEHTYTAMMDFIVTAQSIRGKNADKLRMLPSQWDEQLQDCSISSGNQLRPQWLGHYTCVHPWPKNEAGLKEAQTCAEKWTEADPLTLEISSTRDSDNNFWPVIFADIPILNDSIPPPEWFAGDKIVEGEQGSSRAGPYTFLRGLASFTDIKQIIADAEAAEREAFVDDSDVDATTPSNTPTTSPRTSSSIGPVKYHPYASLRLRGIIHPTPTHLPSTPTHNAYTQPELADIPGWQRIVMVLYKPMTLYLIQVLENAMQDYVYLEDPFGPGLNLNKEVTEGLGNSIARKGIVIPAPVVNGMIAPAEVSATETFQSSTNGGVSAGLAMAAAADFLTQEEIDDVIRGVLERYVGLFEGYYGKYGKGSKDASDARATPTAASSATEASHKPSPIWTADFIHQLESEFSPLASLETGNNNNNNTTATSSSTNTTNNTTSSHTSQPAPPLQWEDIEYAYIYEGAILPGGKMMMGRWWRCGTVLGGGDGGEGMEVVEDNTIVGEDTFGEGVGGGESSGETDGEGEGDVEMGGTEGELGGTGNGAGGTQGGGWGRERGAWVFWS